ncbi:mitochondrial translation release factor in rescue [Onthophagus taurus]|uniref:mitochondrial translation release factor in rescue n=1 Tax=Onthophagus taurus TaxID=166361 RepID=UPI000C200009|nr:probable peptide chain release factor C12orf65, mitochondrial [Onthophagus taurus]
MILRYIIKPPPLIIANFKRLKHCVDYTKVPKLFEKDLEEQHVRGSGPGGQATNKTSNCVVLKHLPTGIVVKCHEDRSLMINRKKARAILIQKLDNLINKEESVQAQIDKIEKKKSEAALKKREKLKTMKEEWKRRENIK